MRAIASSRQDRCHEPRLSQSCGHPESERLGIRPFRPSSAPSQPRRPDDRWCLRRPWPLRGYRSDHLPHRAGRAGHLRWRRPAALRPRLAADPRGRHRRVGTATVIPGSPVPGANHRGPHRRRPWCDHRDRGRLSPARAVRGLAHSPRCDCGDRDDQSSPRRAADHRAVPAASAVRDTAVRDAAFVRDADASAYRGGDSAGRGSHVPGRGLSNAGLYGAAVQRSAIQRTALHGAVGTAGRLRAVPPRLHAATRIRATTSEATQVARAALVPRADCRQRRSRHRRCAVRARRITRDRAQRSGDLRDIATHRRTRARRRDMDRPSPFAHRVRRCPRDRTCACRCGRRPAARRHGQP